MLYALLALVALVATAGSFYWYRESANILFLVLAIVFLLATVGLGGMFLSGRVNKGEDIHITE